MNALPVMMSMALAVLLGLALTPADAYETRINHSPWWAYENDLNSIEKSYQYYYPYYQQQQRQQHKKDSYRWNYPTRDQVRKKKVDINSNRWKFNSFNKDRRKNNNFDWNNYLNSVDFNKIKMPTFRTTTTRRPAMTTREWPAYHLLPPIRMIKLALDEPPQP